MRTKETATNPSRNGRRPRSLSCMWFAVQASTFAPDALQRVKALMMHEAYDSTNPKTACARS